MFYCRVITFFAVLCLFVADHAAAEDAKPDERWKFISGSSPSLGVRTVFEYILQCVAEDRNKDRVAESLSIAASMQDVDASSPTYGNFRWRSGEDKPDDLNAVEFCMHTSSIIWLVYRDRLGKDASARLEKIIRTSVEGIKRHKVSLRYTNIFLMKCWNQIWIGESLGLPDLAREGSSGLKEWWADVQVNGIHEYLSTGYYGIDLDVLGLVAKHAKDKEVRSIAADAVGMIWVDVAANWFEPGLRLGGVHSRDYDYLKGHGELDKYLKAAGWMPDDGGAKNNLYVKNSAAFPSGSIRESLAGKLPRTVIRRFGDKPEQYSVHYLGRRFSISTAGSGYSPEDKVFVINFPGGPDTVVGNFVMDGRRDPYGVNKEITGGGHRKSHHLRPFIAGVQLGPESLLLAADDSEVQYSGKMKRPLDCLMSHIVFPCAAQVWNGEEKLAMPPDDKPVQMPAGSTLFLRLEDVAVAIRFVLAVNTEGGKASVEWINDGSKLGASRFTCSHSEKAPKGRGVLVLWAFGAEGLDDAGFAAFRKSCAGKQVKADLKDDIVDVQAGAMHIRADVAKRKRLLCCGGENAAGLSPLKICFPPDGTPRPWTDYLDKPSCSAK